MDESNNKIFTILSSIIVLLVIVILFYGLGDIPLMSFNEARRALPIKNMFEHGDLLLPYLNDELYIDKPPLFYWLGLGISEIAGNVNEWTIRLISAVAAIGIVIHTALLMKKLQTRWHALLIVAILMTCTNFVIFARRSEIEMLLTFFCATSLLCAFDFICLSGKRISLYLSYSAMGLAILCKGPVALLFVQTPVIVMAFHQERARQYLRNIVGWLLLLVIGGSWYAMVTLKMGSDIWQKVVEADIKNKIAGTKSDPIYDYVLFILADFFPWSLILLLTPIKTVKCWWNNDTTRFFLISIIVPLVCLSLFANKHAKYFLSAYPIIAILITFALYERFSEWQIRSRRAFVVALITLPLCYASYFAFVEHKLFNYRFSGLLELKEVGVEFENTPLVSYKNVDMRSVYYYGQSIKIVKKESLQIIANQEPTLLLLEKDKFIKELDTSGWQTIEIIKPYLGRDQSAVLLANKAFINKFSKKIPKQ